MAVFGGWGCGTCFFCKNGDEQMCNSAKWPGLSSFDGGYSEYVLVPSYRFVIRVERKYGTNPENLAPLTDAGLTPYRAIKKVKSYLGPGKSIAIFGIGGLGSYAIQYAKILGGGSTVIALDRNDDKLDLAKNCGADYTVNVEKSSDIKQEIMNITSDNGIDVLIDCVGMEKTIHDSIQIIGKSGIIVVVGLFGKSFEVPVTPLVFNEYKIIGSFWGNYNELREVIELQNQGKIKSNTKKFTLSEINEALDLLKHGKIIGRGIIIP